MPAVADGLAVRTDAIEAIAAHRTARPTRPAHDDKQEASGARPAAVTPWQVLAANARSVVVGIAACLIVLLTIEVAVFRSGFFLQHATFSSPIPAAKLALAARYTDTRTLFVGDSTVLTGVMPTVVTETCECGGGFNAAFAYSSPWLTAAMTRRLIERSDPRLVVVSVAPWDLRSSLRYTGGPYALDLLSPEESAALGVPIDASGTVDAKVGQVWSAYGRRALVQEWLASFVPGHRYDDTERGYYFVPGSLLSRAQLETAAASLDLGPSDPPTASGPGASVIRSLLQDLRARGIAVAILIPPLHPAASELAGPYIERSDAALRELAASVAAPVIDCRSAPAAADFRDIGHLNRTGAAKFSSCVGSTISALVPR
jgi:hypothetical protein